MKNPSLGLALALVASLLYAAAVCLQAAQARRVPVLHTGRPSLLARLARRPLWLIGAATGVCAWLLQAAALTRAPLTLVAPTLAASLVFILAVGVSSAHQPPTRRDNLGVVAVVVGVAGLTFAAPAHHPGHDHGPLAAALLGGFGLLAAAPYLGRNVRLPVGLVAASAGIAYGLVAVITKFATDDLASHAWWPVLGWVVLVVAIGATGLLGEMSALQTQPAHRIAPIVFGLNILIPVLVAPTVAHETWSSSPAVRIELLGALAFIISGVAVLTRSPRLETVLAAPATNSPATFRQPLETPSSGYGRPVR